MKLYFLCIAAIFLLIAGCSKDSGELDDQPTLLEEQERVIQQLSESPWLVSSVTTGSSDNSSSFNDFVLTFGNKTYSASNGGDVWKSSGTWDFVEGKTDQILRDDDVVIDFELSITLLTLSFEIEEEILIGERTKTVATEYIFVLQK